VYFRASFRHHRRRPAVLIAVVLALSLAISGVVTVQAIVARTLISPFGPWCADSVVGFRHGTDRTAGNWYSFPSVETFAQSNALEIVAAYGELRPQQPVAVAHTVDHPRILMVSEGYFRVCDIPMAAGRSFTPADDAVGASPRAVLSYRYALRRFGTADRAVGSSISIGDVAATVIGVAPKRFVGIDLSVATDVFLPLSVTPYVNPLSFEWFDRRGPMWLQIFGRLRPGHSVRSTNEMLATQLSSVPPQEHLSSVARTRVADIRELAVPPKLWERYANLLMIFTIVSAGLLLLAAVSAGNVFFVRSEQRRRDALVYRMLGATSLQLWRYHLFEAFCLTLVALAVGAPLCFALRDGVLAIATVSGLPLKDVSLDLSLHAVLVAFATIATATLIISTIAWYAFAAAESVLMRTNSGDQGQVSLLWVRRITVAIHTCVVMVLLAVSGLLVRSVYQIYSTPLGYATDQVTEVTLDLTGVRMEGSRRADLYEEVLADLRRALPDSPAGLSGREWSITADRLAGSFPERNRARRQVLVRTVSVGYFSALGLAPRLGSIAPDVPLEGVVVSEALSRQLDRTTDVLGTGLSIEAGIEHPRVIAVVPDVRQSALHPVIPTVYLPFGTIPEHARTSEFQEAAEPIPKTAMLAVRTTNSALVRSVVALNIREFPAARVNVETSEERIRRQAAPQRLGAIALAICGATGLALSLLSLYGLTSSVVTARLREIGVHLALGASARHLFTLLGRDTVLMTLVGIGAGVAIVSSTRPLLAYLLVGVGVLDLQVLSSIGVMLLLISIVTVYLPVKKALRSDPQELLREN
jgi:putative ABC transport system permease protein